jgi:hypothetical protein
LMVNSTEHRKPQKDYVTTIETYTGREGQCNDNKYEESN